MTTPGPLWLVDGFNVLHAAVLRGRDRAGWWRPQAQARLLDALRPLAGGPATLRVVFDGREGQPPAPAPAGLEVVVAPSADDEIVAQAALASARREVTVFSSDRALRERARAAGARVLGPHALWERA